MDFAGNVEPSGWLFCFGQALPRTGIYADLFAVIGTLYGAPDGSSFSLPDFRGRVGAGRDNMGGTAANRMTAAWSMDGTVLGANGGGESHLLTIAQMPAHQHSIPYPYSAASGIASGAQYNRTTVQDNTTFAGGGAAHPNVQPTLIVNRIIKYTIAAVVLPIVPGTGDVTGPSGGVADGDLVVYNGTSGKIIRRVSGGHLPRGYLAGYTLSNNAADAVNDIDIQTGECRTSANNDDIILATVLTKRLDATFVAGNNQGGREIGSTLADDTTWHVYAIRSSSAGSVDVMFSNSATDQPVLPSGFNELRRIGAVIRRGGTILPFVQRGDYFDLLAPTLDVNNITLAASVEGFFAMVNSPNGAPFLCRIGIQLSHPTLGAYIQLRSGSPPFTANSYIPLGAPYISVAGRPDTAFLHLWTSGGQGIAAKTSAVAGTYTIYMATQGWQDPRGRGL